MKAIYLNPMISSLSAIFKAVVQIEPEKGELKKLERLETKKDFLVLMDIDGQLNGFFSFAINTNTIENIVHTMTGGMGGEFKMDELAKSCVLELGGMIKNSMVNALGDVGYESEIKEILFFEKENIPLYSNESILSFTLLTEIGEIDLVFSINKKG